MSDLTTTPDPACARVGIGRGTDTWDPVCDLPDGHPGLCSWSPAARTSPDPSSAPSEAGAQEADCPSSEKQLSRARTPDEYGWPTDAIEKLDALTERVRVLEEALRRICVYDDMPAGEPWRVAYSTVVEIAREALSGGGEQHDE